MSKIEEYNWNILYQKAEKFIREIVPETQIRRDVKGINSGRPFVYASFPVKGHKEQIQTLKKNKNIRFQNFSNEHGKRIFYFGIMFSEKGEITSYEQFYEYDKIQK